MFYLGNSVTSIEKIRVIGNDDEVCKTVVWIIGKERKLAYVFRAGPGSCFARC